LFRKIVGGSDCREWKSYSSDARAEKAGKEVGPAAKLLNEEAVFGLWGVGGPLVYPVGDALGGQIVSIRFGG